MSALVADVELPPTRNGFEGGLLLELLAGLRACPDGGLVAITSSHVDVADNLERWSRFTGNAIVGKTETDAGTRWVVRNGAAPTEPMRRVGARLWLYSNFDCNLACQYCCVRSTPRAERRALGLDVVQAIAREARDLGTEEIFITGGEPFLLADIDDIARACAEVAPTTILTNGALFSGKRRDALDRMPRDRVTLQISLDSPTPHRHDLLRGEGTWDKAWRGIRTARERPASVCGDGRLCARGKSSTRTAAERLAPEDRRRLLAPRLAWILPRAPRALASRFRAGAHHRWARGVLAPRGRRRRRLLRDGGSAAARAGRRARQRGLRRGASTRRPRRGLHCA
ncbi:MAG: radical SAM protein [Polyangiaceae bacterium]